MANDGYFYLPALEALAENYRPVVVRLSAESLTLLLCTMPFCAAPFHWRGLSGAPTSEEQDIIDAVVGTAFGELSVTPLIGTIFAYATTAPPEGALPCDGGTYARAAFPALYAALDAAYIVDADNFTTPDATSWPILGVYWGIWAM